MQKKQLYLYLIDKSTDMRLLLTLTSFLFFLVLGFFSCQTTDEKRNIKDFYFPIEQLKDGLVYEYKPINNDSLPTEYWYYRTIEQDGNTYFMGNYYDDRFIPLQFFREEVVGNGTIMVDYFFFLGDSTGKQERFPLKILVGNSFPFEVKDSTGVFLFKVRLTHPIDTTITTTDIKNRRYIGDANYNYQGENVACVKFSLIGEIDHNNNKGHLIPQYHGEELYAKDIGLIYYKKTYAGGSVLEYGLKNTYPMQEFEKKFDIFLSKEQ